MNSRIEKPDAKKRTRKHKSCLPCARAKRKCCQQLPCTNCKIRNLDCVYDNGRTSYWQATEGADTQPASDSVSSSAGDDCVSCRTDVDSSRTGADFVVRLGSSHQRKISRYYGPTSGPSLLIGHKLYTIKERDLRPFPKESIPDLHNLLTSYYENVHWAISCFEWADLLEWLKTDNVPEINALIYAVLSLSCKCQGRCQESDVYLQKSMELCPGQIYSPSTSRSHWALVLKLLRIYACDACGQWEEMWQHLTVAIGSATAMGYHRQWDFEPGERGCYWQNARSRVWYSLLLLECKLSINLGRPYMVRREMYDCPLPSSVPYNYETSFRDALNRLVPICTVLIDELFKKEPSYDNLMHLDQRVSQWMFENASELHEVSKGGTRVANGLVSDAVLDVQRLLLSIYRLFIRSRLHRAFLTSENMLRRAYCTEQFCRANQEFFELGDRLLATRNMLAFHDLTSVLVDNALFYGIKLSQDAFMLFENCASDALGKSRMLLKRIVTGFPVCPAVILAQRGLEVLDTLATRSAKPVNMTHPLEECDVPSYPMADTTTKGLGHDSIPVHMSVPTPPPSTGSFGPTVGGTLGLDLTSLPAAFDIADWDQWLRSVGITQGLSYS